MRSRTSIKRLVLVTGMVCAMLGAGAVQAGAQTGGTAGPSEPTSSEPAPVGPPGRAILKANGKAIAPSNAPTAVKKAIAAGNRIRKKPYIYGGGHRSFKAKGYDCSGAVSFVLRAAGMLSSPMPSGPLMNWGETGKGRWITVYAHGGHTYAVIAGLRWDTSSMGYGGKGPRWRATKRKPRGFTVRHFPGY